MLLDSIQTTTVQAVMRDLLAEPRVIAQGQSTDFGIHDCKIPLDQYHQNNLTTLEVRLHFQGRLHVKIGVWRDNRSYTWLTDKAMSSFSTGSPGMLMGMGQQQQPVSVSVPIDISTIPDGNLEIKILALADTQLLSCEITHTIRPFLECQASDVGTLCNFIWPKKDICTEEPLYFHLDGPTAYFSIEQQHVVLQPGDQVDLTSYFNSFSAGKWQKYTNVDELTLSLDFSGEIEVELCHLEHHPAEGNRDQGAEDDKPLARTLHLGRVRHGRRATVFLHIGKYPATGILGCKIRALGKSTIHGGGFSTPCAVVQPARLGISITTFKREEATQASTRRIAAAIAANPVYKDRISLTIVDNGKTLNPEDVPGATLIPNKNLGGSGGFMRGLLHYQDLDAGHTHCLFMDDDAFCEPESIFRALAFIEHAHDDRLSIGGAMLLDDVKFLQWENLAWFNIRCHPLKNNVDLRARHNLIKNELEDDAAEVKVYGAWWFFLFPLKHVKKYAFPFFVRGDDIEFSYTNDFIITSLNGICTWQGHFKLKEAPLPLYLDIRSHLMHHFLKNNHRIHIAESLSMVWWFFDIWNDAYHYDTAKAVLMGFEDFLRGPDFWVKNIDTQEVRKKVKEMMQSETPMSLQDLSEDHTPVTRNLRIPVFHNLLRRLSLNGHLYPEFMMEKKTLWKVTKFDMPLPRRTYLRKRLIEIDPINDKYILLERNPRKYFSNLSEFISLAISLVVHRRQIENSYRASFDALTSKVFWQEQIQPA